VASDERQMDAGSLLPILFGHFADAGPETPRPPDITVLALAVGRARRQYQSCRYSELIEHLSRLLVSLDAACPTLDDDAKSKAFALSADTYDVAAGTLPKLGDQGLACLAADRSMRAARASEDPVTIGASARIITHALISGGHLAAAISTASSHAARLTGTCAPIPPSPCPCTGRCCAARTPRHTGPARHRRRAARRGRRRGPAARRGSQPALDHVQHRQRQVAPVSIAAELGERRRRHQDRPRDRPQRDYSH
jgi:hypothetical protein